MSNKPTRTDRVGETITNKYGTYTIIEYNSFTDIKVLQDDGYVFKTSYQSFASGKISGNRFNDKDEKIGRTCITKQGFQVEIIKYKNGRCTVRFNDKYNTELSVIYRSFKNGTIKNPHYYYLADKFLIDKELAKENPVAYQKYRAMIDRCYGKQKYNNVVYKGCEVCKEWNLFENFIKWFNENYYEIDNEKMELDKDLFGNGKLYSPSTCVFIPHKLNTQIARRKDHDRDNNLPLGVSLHITKQGKVRYRVTSLAKGQLFDDIENAYKAYKENVINQYRDFATGNKNEIPKKLYDYLINYTFKEN
jgi:hypothetical protein